MSDSDADLSPKPVGSQWPPLRSISLFAFAFLSLVLLYVHDYTARGIVLQSCSRPAVLLLGAVWSLTAVAFICQLRGIDVTRILSGGKDSASSRTGALEYELALLATGLTFAYLIGAVFIHMLLDYQTQNFEWELFSVGAFLLLLGFVLSPVRILPLAGHRANVVRSLGRTICSGVFPVCFADVICGDYLTSFSKGFGDLFICPCAMTSPAVWGCITSMATPVACSLPFFARFLQCLRCYSDNPGQNRHLANALKYTVGITVVFSSTLKRRGYPSQVYYFCVGANSLYSFYWDVVWDWGLNMKNFSSLFPGRQFMFPTWVYPTCAALDFFLRVSWSWKLVAPMGGEEAVWLAMSCELLRRTMWACLRIEYEAYVQGKDKRDATAGVGNLGVPLKKRGSSPVASEVLT